MSHQTHSKYRPRPYTRRMPIFWWVHKRQHVRFILRELTSVFIAAYAVVILFLIRAVSAGPEAYESFLSVLMSPVSVVLHFVILAFAVFHTYTWFNLAPTAMVIRFGGKKVPAAVLVAGNFTAWIVLSLALAWFIISA